MSVYGSGRLQKDLSPEHFFIRAIPGGQVVRFRPPLALEIALELGEIQSLAFLLDCVCKVAFKESGRL